MSEIPERPDFDKVTRMWMTKFGKIHSYPTACAFKGSLQASLIMPDVAVELRRIGSVLLVMPGEPGDASPRPGAIIELEPDDKGENFSAVLTRAQTEDLIDRIPEGTHGPIRVHVNEGVLEVFNFNVDIKITLTHRQRPAA